MSDKKLFGIEMADGTICQHWTNFGDSVTGKPACRRSERVVEIVAVKKERLAALEEVVRAADRMRSLVQDTWIIYSDQRGSLLLRAHAYDSKRAALGEIGGE